MSQKISITKSYRNTHLSYYFYLWISAIFLPTVFPNEVMCTEKQIKANNVLYLAQFVNKLCELHMMILDTMVQKRPFRDCVQHIGFQIWDNMSNDMLVVACGVFSTNNLQEEKEEFLHPFPKGTTPLKTIHVDHLDPFPKSIRRNEYIVVILDAFTKFIFLQVVKSTRTRFVLEFFLELFVVNGIPEIFVSDLALICRNFVIQYSSHFDYLRNTSCIWIT